jgi:hypothetical protein
MRWTRTYNEGADVYIQTALQYQRRSTNTGMSAAHGGTLASSSGDIGPLWVATSVTEFMDGLRQSLTACSRRCKHPNADDDLGSKNYGKG